MTTLKDVRSTFLNFFEKNGHKVEPSSSLVPHNDPTLMFTNAGMNQFKDVFTGKETRDYKRATTSQKCVRAGGKHNDLENVGYTARHHTFFEMLGNFSFGDYFKEDAIEFSWELLTKHYGINADKLCVTVYHSDDEAFNIWKKVTGFHDDKIIRIATDDNFWRMGETGPCGPCTEIFYDHGDHIWGGPPGSAEEDGDRFIEIWNNVFMQHEQIDADTLIDLPAQSVDTGMGLERLTATLLGSNNNYDIDVMQVLIGQVADIVSVDPKGAQSASHKVIADHLRSCAFLMADGVLPSNEGRGYVLRRIMRRAMRHAHLLGAQDPLMHQLVPTLLSLMGEAYPELIRAQALMSETFKTEETKFKKMLETGLKILDEEKAELSKGDKLSGDVAFKLYDTYGFPLDLTQDALRADDIGVDTEAFDKNMEAQRQAARAAWSGSGEVATEKLWFELLEQHGSTEFLGYDTYQAEAKIIALVKSGDLVEHIDEGDEAVILTNQTPFYAESGGQVGDKGQIKIGEAVFDVTDTKKQLGALFLHMGTLKKGTVKLGETAVMSADGKRRKAIQANHSATHLLHAALREYLGDHITQKGSLVAYDRLRFDISHPKQITAEEIALLETRVNYEIRANSKAETRLMNRDEAIEAGAMALFGEKYDDEVRVLAMGQKNPKTGHAFSVELCGGTHVTRTGDIGLFKIISEGAVSSGVRRIEAVTGEGALAYFADQEAKLSSVAGLLKTTPGDVTSRLNALVEEKKKLEQEVANLRKKIATGGGSEASNDEVKKVGDTQYIGKVLEDFPAKDLKSMADELTKKLGSGVVALVATNEGKASIVVAVTKDITDKISAVDLVKIGSEALGGKGGGGRPDMAQAGGPNSSLAPMALTEIEKALS